MFGCGEYEVLVVDDGSRDRTVAVVNALAADWLELHLISLPENRGKGAALRTGCVNARGELILMYDADGATPIEQEAVLRSELTERSDIHLAMGIRYRNDSDVTMGVIRRSLGCLFADCASLVVGRRCADTQCGFKMIRRQTVLPIVRQCRENGYTFDVELLAATHRLGFGVCECSISWTAMTGSKVSVWRDGATMLWRLAVIRLRQMSGVFEQSATGPEQIFVPPSVNGGQFLRSADLERARHD
jgi:dolichyl-phosphate beta-glucosyltransferase